MSTWNQQANAIFLDAMEIACPVKQGDFIARACGMNLSLKREVEQLIAAQHRAGEFLAQSAARLPADLQPPLQENLPRAIGPYQILDKIAEGGMGIVYLAQSDPHLRRKVALKVIKPGLDTRQVIARFEAERQVLALMDHPNIARVLDGGTTDSGRPYFVMELVRGEPLTVYCKRHEVTLRERLRLFIDACRAVQHAHQRGVIHRDIKPSNILVTVQDGGPVIKVIDFGISKALGQSLAGQLSSTSPNQLLGTPLYMSPEQAVQSIAEVDTRSDIYSLGVVLYELLTGTTPLEEQTIRESPDVDISMLVRTFEPPPPSVRVSDRSSLRKTARIDGPPGRRVNPARELRGELDWIVMTALEKDRDRRYQSASALAADVERYLNNEPVLACPPSVLYRWRKLARRNRAAILAGGFAAFGLLIGACLAVWQAIEADRAREDSDQNLSKVRALNEQLVIQRQVADSRAESARESALDARRWAYAGDMHLATEAWQSNDVPKMRELLDRHVPAAGEVDLRGFEWYFLRQQIGMQSRTVLKVESPLYTVRLSPDGRLLAVSGADAQIRLIDSSTFEPVRQIDSAQKEVNSVEFSPDGRRIVSAGDDGSIAVWDVQTGRELARRDASTLIVNSALFSPDGASVISGSRDGRVLLWDAMLSNPPVELVQVGDFIESMSMAPDGLLAVGSKNDRVSLLKLPEAASVRSIADSPPSKVNAVSIASPNLILVVGHDDGFLTIHLDRDHSQVLKQKFPDPIHSVAISPASSSDEQPWLAVGDQSGTVTLLSIDSDDAPSGIIANSIRNSFARQWSAHEKRVFSMTFSADGRRLFTAGEDGSIMSWEIQSTRGERAIAQDIDSFAMTGPDEVVAASKSLIRYSLTGTRKSTVLARASGSFEYLRFCPAANALYVIDHPGRLMRVELSPNLATREWPLAPDHVPGAMAVSSDGRQVAMRIVNARTDASQIIFPINPECPPIDLASITHGMVILADGRVACDQARDIVIFDPRNPGSPTILSGHRSTIESLSVSPDGRLLASTSKDRTIRVWDPQTASQIWSEVAHGSSAQGVAFSNNGSSLVSTGFDGMLRIWRWRRKSMVLEFPFTGTPTRKLELSSDGQRLLLLVDGTLKLYDTDTLPAQQSGIW